MLRCSLLLIATLALAAAAVAQPADVLRESRQHLFEEHYQKAAALLEASSELTPEGQYLLGRAYQGQLRHEQAAAAFAQADTTRPRVLAAWGRSLHELGRSEAALRRYESAYRRDSSNASVAQALAVLYARHDRWPDVRRIFADLLAQDSENPFLLAQLGRAYQELDSTETALAYYKKAFHRNPQSVEVPIRLSRLYQALDSLGVAEMYLEQALHQHPEQPALWRRLGEVTLRSGRYGLSVNAFKNAAAYGDSSTTTLSNLGAALYSSGRSPDALPPLRTSFQADSTLAVTAYYLGLTHKALDRPDSALVYLRHAARHYGRSTLADLYEHVGDAYKEQEAFAEAIRADRVALGLEPGKKTVLFHLATVYDAYYTDPSAAREYYERFLDRTAEGELPEMRAHATARLADMRERAFFTDPQRDTSENQ